MGHRGITLLHLAVVIGPRLRIKPSGKTRGLRISPRKILITVFLIPGPFPLPIAYPVAGDLPTIRRIISNGFKPPDGSGLPHNRQPQDLAYSVYRYKIT